MKQHENERQKNGGGMSAAAVSSLRHMDEVRKHASMSFNVAGSR